MEMKKSAFSYLEPLYMESRIFEETQELRIPEGMPDAEKILGVWGQPILRSKDWRTDTIGFSAGIFLWVLYRPEDGSAPRMLEGWVPIQGRWTLPQETAEGKLLLNLAPAFLDGRTVSPRKILVRCGLGATVQALAPAEGAQYAPEDLPEDVYTLERTVGLMLYTEAGEKTFQMEETLGEGKLLCYTIHWSLTDQKVVGNKLAFRGNIEIQALLDGETPGSREFQFPFSQIAELDKTFGSDAQSDITLCVTSLEPEGETLKLGLTAQYAIADKQELHTLMDAYSNLRPVELTVEEAFFPAILDSRWETVPCRGTLPENIPGATQMTAWTEPVGLKRREEGTVLTAQGTAQILWEGEKGLLGSQIPLEGERLLNAPGEVTVTACQMGKPLPDSSGIGCELKCHVVRLNREGIPQVTGLDLGEPTAPDPDRPSLILCRAEQKDLWTLAKETGSSVEAIQKANGLEGEPPQGKMLLIPIA